MPRPSPPHAHAAPSSPQQRKNAPPPPPLQPRRVHASSPARQARVPISRNVNVPVSARARLQSALMSTAGSSVRAGYLHRRQQKGRSFYGAQKYTWVWTYFVVRDGVLQRFDDIHGSGTGQPTVVYPLRGATVDQPKGKPNTLRINFPKSSGIHASLILRAQNPESAKTWLADFSVHCAINNEVKESDVRLGERGHGSARRQHESDPAETYSSAPSRSMMQKLHRDGRANGAKPNTTDPFAEQALSVRVSGSATMRAICGVPSHFSIHPPKDADDEWDDAIDVELLLDGDQSNSADVALAFNEDSDDDEEVNGTYCVTQAGTWLLNVTYKEHAVFGSPFTIAAQAADPDPMSSVVTGDGIHRADFGGALQTVLVEVRDRFGNFCAWMPTPDKPIDIAATFSLVSTSSLTDEDDAINEQSYPCDVNGIGAGCFEVLFAFPANSLPRTESSGMLQVFLNGEEIKGSPFYPELNVSARIESLLHPSRRPSVHQMQSRGLLEGEDGDFPENIRSTVLSRKNSFRARRASLLERLARRGSADLLRSRGILQQPSEISGKPRAGRSSEDSTRHEPRTSMWSSGTFSLDVKVPPKGAMEPRPGPWASAAELCTWLPVRRNLIYEALSLVLVSLNNEVSNGRSLGFASWKHRLVSFSKYLTAAYREAEAVWSDAEQAAFCELLEALETGDLDDRVKTKICDLMVDYVEVQRQLSATLQSTAVVWRPTEGRRADRSESSPKHSRRGDFQSPDPGTLQHSLKHVLPTSVGEFEPPSVTLKERFHVSLAEAQKSTADESPPSKLEKQVYGSKYGMVGMYQSQEGVYATPIVSALGQSRVNNGSLVSLLSPSRTTEHDDLASRLLRESAALAAKSSTARSSPEKIDDLLGRLVKDNAAESIRNIIQVDDSWEDTMDSVAGSLIDSRRGNDNTYNKGSIMVTDDLSRAAPGDDEKSSVGEEDNTRPKTISPNQHVAPSARTDDSDYDNNNSSEKDDDTAYLHSMLAQHGTQGSLISETKGSSALGNSRFAAAALSPSSPAEGVGLRENSYHKAFLEAKLAEQKSPEYIRHDRIRVSERGKGRRNDTGHSSSTRDSSELSPDGKVTAEPAVQKMSAHELNSYYNQHILKSTPQQHSRQTRGKKVGKHSKKADEILNNVPMRTTGKNVEARKGVSSEQRRTNIKGAEQVKTGDIVQVGSRVSTTVRGTTEDATVAFLGDTKFAPGIWYGLRLDRAVGKNNGTVQGIRYFYSEARRGLFVKRGNIKPIVSHPRNRRRIRSQQRAARGGSHRKNKLLSRSVGRPSWKSSTMAGGDSKSKSPVLKSVREPFSSSSFSNTRSRELELSMPLGSPPATLSSPKTTWAGGTDSSHQNKTMKSRITRKGDDALFDLLKDGLETVWQMQSGAKQLRVPENVTTANTASMSVNTVNHGNNSVHETSTKSRRKMSRRSPTDTLARQMAANNPPGSKQESPPPTQYTDDPASYRTNPQRSGLGRAEMLKKSKNETPLREVKVMHPPTYRRIEAGVDTSAIPFRTIPFRTTTRLSNAIHLSGESPEDIALRLLGPPPPSLDLDPPEGSADGAELPSFSGRSTSGGEEISSEIATTEANNKEAAATLAKLLSNLGLEHLRQESSLRPYLLNLEAFGSLPHSVLSATSLSSRDKGAVIGAGAAVRANLAEVRGNGTRESIIEKKQEIESKRALPRPPRRPPPPRPMANFV